jgi:hypothetical protein
MPQAANDGRPWTIAITELFGHRGRMTLDFDHPEYYLQFYVCDAWLCNDWHFRRGSTYLRRSTAFLTHLDDTRGRPTRQDMMNKTRQRMR